MRPLTAPPRDHLMYAEVSDLLTGSTVQVEFGADLLAADLTFREDISADLRGGSVDRNCNATIHGTCRLELSRKLVWGVDLVQPFMVLSDGGVSARWNLGVFALATPEHRAGETPVTYAVDGYDRLMLLGRQVGADYTVTSGTSYRTALLAVFAAAGLPGVTVEGSAADSTLPATRTWSLVASDESDPDQTNTPVTWLRIVNDLLRAINFQAVWCDDNGIFRCQAYERPEVRPPEWVFDTDELTSIVGEDRTEMADVWATPNRWVFRGTNFGTGVEGDGVYTVVNQSDGPTSVDGRGLTWTSVLDYEAAGQSKLVDLGDRRVSLDRRVTARLDVSTGPFPGAGHWDVFTFVDAVAGSRKVLASGWRMPLDGGDVSWDWEQI